MTDATQAPKTNENTPEETGQTNDGEVKKSTAQLGKEYRQTKEELYKTKGVKKELEQENNTLKEKLTSIEERMSEIEAIKKENEEIKEQFAQKTLEETREKEKQNFFSDRPYLEEYRGELESNVGEGDFEQEALLYMAKTKPELLTETGYNKTKTEKMRVSGTPTWGTAQVKDVNKMSSEEYKQALINGEI